MRHHYEVMEAVWKAIELTTPGEKAIPPIAGKKNYIVCKTDVIED